MSNVRYFLFNKMILLREIKDAKIKSCKLISQHSLNINKNNLVSWIGSWSIACSLSFISPRVYRYSNLKHNMIVKIILWLATQKLFLFFFFFFIFVMPITFFCLLNIKPEALMVCWITIGTYFSFSLTFEHR